MLFWQKTWKGLGQKIGKVQCLLVGLTSVDENNSFWTSSCLWSLPRKWFGGWRQHSIARLKLVFLDYSIKTSPILDRHNYKEKQKIKSGNFVKFIYIRLSRCRYNKVVMYNITRIGNIILYMLQWFKSGSTTERKDKMLLDSKCFSDLRN